MPEEMRTLFVSIISWGFLLYFVILFAERAISVLKSVRDPAVKLFGTGYDIYTYTLTLLSIAAAVVLLAGFNARFWTSLFDGSVLPDYTMLTFTAGVILFSGMVHTEHTFPPLQFTAYGMLIVSMVLQTIISVSDGQNALGCWYSMIYLTIFSMAVPVVYRSGIKLHALFHVIEAVTSAALVCCFTFMLCEMFNGRGEDLLLPLPIMIAAVLDTVIIAMRWKEEKNMFVLIFEALSVLAFIVGRIVFAA